MRTARDREQKTDPVLKAFVVFNIAQTDYQEKGYQLRT